MLEVIMPMAGEASRFQGSQYTAYKPFIELKGRKLYQWALSSLGDLRYQLFPIIQKKHDDGSSLNQYQKTLLDHSTRGAAETCSFVLGKLAPQDPVLVLDCDLMFHSSEYLNFLRNPTECDGALLTFTSQRPRFSYVRVDQEGLALEVREKQVISDRAIVGAYYFRSARVFQNYLEKSLSRELVEREYYLSDLYQMMIEDGSKVQTFDCENHISLGTPEEIEQHLSFNTGQEL
jgi:dTDP-glucose pyrophosphorylase